MTEAGSELTFADRLTGARAELAVEGTVFQDLPTLATDALVEGLDSQSLRLLAGQPAGTAAELDNRDLFRAALRELGYDPMPRDEAVWQLIRFWAGTIRAGLVEPMTGAQRIARLGYEPKPTVPDITWSFLGLVEEAEEDWGRPEDEVVVEIVELAGQVFSAAGPEDLRAIT